MKYHQPWGVSDPNAGYLNGNPAAGIQGSIPPAEAVEQPMREIVNTIIFSNLVPVDDLTQLLKAIRSQYLNFAVDTGVANAMVVALLPQLDAYKAGIPLHVLIAATNTGATTINVNGVGLRAVKRADGSDLQAGDLVGGMIANLIDTGTVYQLQNANRGVAGTSNVFTVGIPYAADSGVVNAIQANYSPALTSIVEGQFVSVKVAFANTGPVTFKPNALPALPVIRQDGQPMQPGDIIALETLLLEHHGTYYQAENYVQSQFPAAPKLRGFRNDLVGYPPWPIGPDYIPQVLSGLNHVVENSLQTSTFDGAYLTIGAGEAGLWTIQGQWVFPQAQYPATALSTTVKKNGQPMASSYAGDVPAGQAVTVFCNSIIRCAVGDKLWISPYQQSWSVQPPIFSEATIRTFMSGILMSQ